MNTTTKWLLQIRAPFLLLSPLLCAIGGAVAFDHDLFHGLSFALCIIGVTLAHIAVNLFNEISDSQTGVDANTVPTPFSGGSKILQSGLLPRSQVVFAAWFTLLSAAAIGAYLAWSSGWILVVFMVIGGLVSVFYTSHLSRWGLGELTAGSTLGSLVVLGTYYAQAQQLPWQVILLSVPPGILTALLLLLNEFPDVDADKVGKRKHLVILLGYRGAAYCYCTLLATAYFSIVLGVVVGLFPAILLISLLTVPLALKASSTALKQGHNRDALIPALGANVGLVLGTDLLIALAFFANSTILG